MSIFKNTNNKTLIKYFFSYFSIFSILIISFFFIIKINLSTRYLEQLSENSRAQLVNLSSELSDNLNFLSQIDTSIKSNVQFVMVRYDTNGFQNYTVWNELNKYDTANELINAICYVHKSSGQVISTQHSIFYQDGMIELRKNSSTDSLTFNPKAYYNTSKGHFIFLSNDKLNYLIYFPAQNSEDDYILFYFIDTSVIKQRLQSLSTDAMQSIALVNQKHQLITGVNSAPLTPYIKELDFNSGIYESRNSDSIYVCPVKFTDFFIVSFISDILLEQQMNRAFASSYLLLFILSGIGFILIQLAMSTTYLPLHKLTQKIIPDPIAADNYLNQLDNAFEYALHENKVMEDKLKKYQFDVKKGLLDAVLKTNCSDTTTDLVDINSLFDSEIKKDLFAIKIKALETISCTDIQKYFLDYLPDGSFCSLLNKENDVFLFLVNYTGNSSNKDKHLLELLNILYTEHKCFSAISNSSTSPMSIPSLCENVLYASKYWSQNPIVNYKTLPTIYKSFSYPHNQLEQIKNALNANSFGKAEHEIKNIFLIIDSSIRIENPLPDFFIRNILIDLCTLIISYMNSARIDYRIYEELYYETLYFCRSCSYDEKSADIVKNIKSLLLICEQHANTQITPLRLKQLIGESCYNLNFSIYELADKLNISFTYASNLVKKELNQNFSDYLWMLRFEKAKELLIQTNMTINEIAIAVGYTNVSSFIRKFKHETTVTPSEFRQNQPPKDLISVSKNDC